MTSHPRRPVRIRSLTRPVGALAVAAALVVVAAGASACNLQLSPYAARVGTVTITPGELDGALSKAASDEPLTCLLQAGGQAKRFKGAGTDTYDSAFAAFVLGDLIDAQLSDDAVHDESIAVTPAARTLASSQVSGIFGNELVESRCGISGTTLVDQLGPTLEQSFERLQVDEDVIVARAAHISLTTASISAYETKHPKLFQESCLDAIDVKTAADAKSVENKLKAGASFSSLAAKDDKGSTLVAANGEVGCGTEAQLAGSGAVAPAVEKTATGHVTAPVSFDSQYLVLLVTSRPDEPASEAIGTLVTSEQHALVAALSVVIHHTKVQVDPKYGTWKPGAANASGTSTALSGRVVPPTGPAIGDVLNESATEGTETPTTTAVEGQG